MSKVNGKKYLPMTLYSFCASTDHSQIFIFLIASVSLYKLSTVALFGLKKWSLITQFSSPITHHSVFITHHSSLKTPHPVWHHHSFVITQYFSTICGPHTCTLCSFYFIYFFPSTPSTQTHRTSEKKKKNKKKKKKKKMKKPRNSKE